MGKGKPKTPPLDPQYELHAAVSSGDASWVRRLLDLGADPNSRIPPNTTIASGWIPLHCAVEWDNAHIAAILLDAGAAIDATDDHGQTPLRQAVETPGKYQIAAPDVARLLIERGANVNARHAAISSILAEAQRSQERDGDDKELIELLEKMGATP